MLINKKINKKEGKREKRKQTLIYIYICIWHMMYIKQRKKEGEKKGGGSRCSECKKSEAKITFCALRVSLYHILLLSLLLEGLKRDLRETLKGAMKFMFRD